MLIGSRRDEPCFTGSVRLRVILYRLSCALLLFIGMSVEAFAGGPILPREPTVHGHDVVFVYADKLWGINLNGGVARELVTGVGVASHPSFSPDGRWLAFTLERDGSEDVYVMPAAGGELRRLTWNPAPNVVVGFTADSKSVLFRSARESYSGRFDQIFTVPVTGGLPQRVALPMAEDISYSPSGRRAAYVPWTYISSGEAFDQYHGGHRARIWIVSLTDGSVAPLPLTRFQDFNPMWVGNAVYFLSDRRNRLVTLYRFDPANGKTTEVLPAQGESIKSASTDGQTIVYETVGALHALDLATGKDHQINIQINMGFANLAPHFIKAGDEIVSDAVSPTGSAAVFGAHGDILTVSAQAGTVTNITHSPGADDRYPAWSPDGKWIAYFSDRSGHNELYLSPADGLGKAKQINLGQTGLFYYSPVWSPDSKKIAYTDQFGDLWYVDLSSARVTKVAQDYYYALEIATDRPTLDPRFSPDSQFIAYTLLMPNHLRSVFIYSVATDKSVRVTNSGADARYVSWDKSGHYLFFAASTNFGPSAGSIDMSGFMRRVTRQVYAVLLQKNLLSPTAPKTDGEPPSSDGAPGGSDAKSAPRPGGTGIDFDGIGDRIVPLRFPAQRIRGLQAGRPGTLFVAVGSPFYSSTDVGGVNADPHDVYKFNVTGEKTAKFLTGITTFAVSENGSTVLYAKRAGRTNNWFVTPANAKEGAEDSHPLNTENMWVRVVPREEWLELYREEWRMIRDFFYDKNVHGLDTQKAEQHYLPFVKNLVSESGLYYIFNDMRGELVNSHVFMGNRFAERSDKPRVGLLGADYAITHDRYQFARIFGPGHWNPALDAPLAQSDLNVHVGDYLLAVNGRLLTAADNVYEYFENTVGKPTTLLVGHSADGSGAHSIVVTPIPSEVALRRQAWIDHNMQVVDRLSGGKIAYVYLPDTGEAGYDSFNRYFFAQTDKQAVIIDDRFNGGGFISDYIIDYLRRELVNYWVTRERHAFNGPTEAIYGPKAMLINGFSVSGGDALPYYFKHLKIGPLIGMRTTGGLNAMAGAPMLMDGTVASIPRVAIRGSDGQPIVENDGVAPDFRVPLTPEEWRAGQDPQLEKAVEVLLQSLREHPHVPVHMAPFKNYYPQNAGGGTGSER